MGQAEELKELEKDLKIALTVKSMLEKKRDVIRNRLMCLLKEGSDKPSLQEDAVFLDEFTKLVSQSSWADSRLDLAKQAIKEIHKRIDSNLTK